MGLRLSVLLLALFSSLCVAQTSPSESSKTLTVRGQVIQDPGGQPLRKVDLRFTARSAEHSDDYTATTDAEGKFQIENVRPGRYRVLLDRTGFVQSGMRSRLGVNLTLESAADAKDLIFHMQPASVITGKIVDEEGDPIPNASVQVFPPGPGGASLNGFQGYASTNDLGEFRIANLHPGKYLLLVSASGGSRASKQIDGAKDASKGELNYVPTYYPGTQEKAEAVALELHSGDETPVTLSPSASPRFSVRGTFTRPSEALFAEVMLRSADNQTVSSFGGAKPDGSFEFRNVSPGRYTAYLMVVDPASLAGVNQGRQPQAQIMRLGRPIEVTNSDVDGLHLAPESPGHVRGHLRMDKAQKLDWPQLSVMLTPADPSSQGVVGDLSNGFSLTQAKADGSFDLPKVAAGEYRLAITSSSSNLQDYFTKAVNLDGKDVGDTGFSVSGGSYSLDVVICADGATLEGTVFDAKGKPVPEATVLAAPKGERRKRFDVYGQDSSDAKGHFRLRGLMPGEYSVLAWEEVVGNVRDPEFLSEFEDRGEKVHVDEGAQKNVSIKVIPASDDVP